MVSSLKQLTYSAYDGKLAATLDSFSQQMIAKSQLTGQQ
jgi:hypothetical protein